MMMKASELVYNSATRHWYMKKKDECGRHYRISCGRKDCNLICDKPIGIIENSFSSREDLIRYKKKGWIDPPPGMCKPETDCTFLLEEVNPFTLSTITPEPSCTTIFKGKKHITIEGYEFEIVYTGNDAIFLKLNRRGK
jgi:hypothetical protein